MHRPIWIHSPGIKHLFYWKIIKFSNFLLPFWPWCRGISVASWRPPHSRTFWPAKTGWGMRRLHHSWSSPPALPGPCKQIYTSMFSGLRIRIRMILGRHIRIRIGVQSWIRIRICIKIKDSGSLEAQKLSQGKPWSLKMSVEGLFTSGRKFASL